MDRYVAKIADDVYRRIVKRVPPGTDHEDVRQDCALMTLKKYAEGYRGEWLFMRVWGDMKDLYGRSWRKHYRDQKEREEARGDPDQRAYDPTDDNDRAIDVQAALDALAHLNPRHMIAVRMCDAEGRLQADVARELGITLSALKTLLSEGRDFLRRRLEDYE